MVRIGSDRGRVGKGVLVRRDAPVADLRGSAVAIEHYLRQTVSAAGTTRAAQRVVYRIDGLTPGVHTIRLVKQSGTYMLVDRFTIR